MTHARTTRSLQIALTLLAAAAVVAPTLDAEAGSRRRGAPLRLIDINVDRTTPVPQNAVVVLQFNRKLRPRSVNEQSIQIRAENLSETGFTRQVPGEFEVIGKFVRFRPQLPSHMRGQDDAFPPVDSFEDRFAEQGGFTPNTNFQIRILSRPRNRAVRGRQGQRMRRAITKQFSTTPAFPDPDAYTTLSYVDAPPPQVQFTNPPDQPVTVEDQYTGDLRTVGVPLELEISLFMNAVPLSIPTMREPGNITLHLIEQDGAPVEDRTAPGAAYVQQSHDDVRLVFVPDFALEPRSTYALRIGTGVRDLTGQFSMFDSVARDHLSELYEYLAAARSLNPSVPADLLPDPPQDLIRDWPAEPAARGVLKTNLLETGDTRPHEIDPRVMVVYGTE